MKRRGKVDIHPSDIRIPILAQELVLKTNSYSRHLHSLPPYNIVMRCGYLIMSATGGVTPNRVVTVADMSPVHK